VGIASVIEKEEDRERLREPSTMKE